MNIDENKIFQKAMFLAMEGQELTTEQVESLEHACSQNPDGLDARFKLLGYYFSHSFGSSELKARRSKHVLWLINNEPEHPFLETPFTKLEPAQAGQESHNEGRELWLREIEPKDASVFVLVNAANFFICNDVKLAEDCLLRIKAKYPDHPAINYKLGHLYKLSKMKQHQPGSNSPLAL